MVINDIKLRGAHCGITSPRIPGRGHKDNNKSIIVISLRVHFVYPASDRGQVPHSSVIRALIIPQIVPSGELFGNKITQINQFMAA